MTDVIDTPALSTVNNSAFTRISEMPRLWSRIALGAILLLSVFMNFFLLGQNGYGNLYYASAVRSMADSWHNFFFVTFDPGGFLAVDKPPLGFWLQVLSAKIFGFTPFSLFFPQAICGVLAVVLLYYLIRRHFGVGAGLLAALVLAISPISVVTNRNNTIDSTLTLVLLLAAYALIYACETGKLRWLLLSSVFVGVGFNIKMLEAYLVVPTLIATYWLYAPHKSWTRFWHLLLFLLLMLVLSLSWISIVDLTPTSQRPYVGSTQDNSELTLALVTNGLNRLQTGSTNASSNQQTTSSASSTSNQVFGPFRLFGKSLGSQVAWLLPLALLSIIALATRWRFAFQQERQRVGFFLWGFWLATMVVFYTIVIPDHQYYLTEMMPALSALVGIGLPIMWREYKDTNWRGWLLPISLVVTAVIQIFLLASYSFLAKWLSPFIAILTVLAVIALCVFRLTPQLRTRVLASRVTRGAVSIGMVALLITPALWAGYSVSLNTETFAPIAGPVAQYGSAANGLPASTVKLLAGLVGGSSGAQANPALVSYLESHQGDTKFLVATPSSSTAYALILTTNRPVMAMGGFNGTDPILTASELRALISNHTVRFFLLNSAVATQHIINQIPRQYQAAIAATFNIGNAEQSPLSTWISDHCNTIQTSSWQPSLGVEQLYDCASFTI